MITWNSDKGGGAWAEVEGMSLSVVRNPDGWALYCDKIQVRADIQDYTRKITLEEAQDLLKSMCAIRLNMMRRALD